MSFFLASSFSQAEEPTTRIPQCLKYKNCAPEELSAVTEEELRAAGPNVTLECGQTINKPLPESLPNDCKQRIEELVTRLNQKFENLAPIDPGSISYSEGEGYITLVTGACLTQRTYDASFPLLWSPE